jgi:hypothetical protein
LTPEHEVLAKALWHRARRVAVRCAAKLDELNVHKQVANRIIEPWDIMVTLVSSTRWRNFDVLRKHKTADPNIKKLADIRKEVYDASTPRLLKPGEWHLPFVTDAEVAEWNLAYAKQVSAGRCARLSYLTHDGKREPSKDIELFNRLVVREADKDPELDPGHWSPLEHQATPIGGFRIDLANKLQIEDHCQWCGGTLARSEKCRVVHFNQTGHVCMKCAWGHVTSGNFIGWHQFRKEFDNENFED